MHVIEILKNYRFFAALRYLSKADNQSENRMPLKRDVPAHTLVGGVPARVIRENVAWK